jgi:sensor histidine kinase YesM
VLKGRNIITHLLGILIFLSIPFIVFEKNESSIALQSIHESNFIGAYVLEFIFLVALFYGNYLFLVPKQYDKNKVVYFILIISLFLLITFVPLFSTKYFNKWNWSTRYSNIDELSLLQYLKTRLLNDTFVYVAVWAFSYALALQNRLDNIITLNKKTEMDYLKAQINPHFLYNTLNSIYALALSKSEATAESILKLSSLMRYTTDESYQQSVLLNKEIKYIEDYINLQKLRLADNIILEYNCTYDEQTKYEIAPFILIHFIENIFKHGIDTEKDCHLIIKIGVDETDLVLYTYNKKVDNRDEESHQVGLKNTMDRLNYYYPLHELKIDDAEDYYEVILKLKLNDKSNSR